MVVSLLLIFIAALVLLVAFALVTSTRQAEPERIYVPIQDRNSRRHYRR